jgi:ABC-type lipoprotein export system ATPase subunit
MALIEPQTELSSPGTANDSTELLRLEDVTKNYVTDGQNVQALCGVSLTVRNGEFTALVGRSGCGKSTLLNLAGAMDFPTSGRVLLDGISTSDLTENGLTLLRRKKIGFIFQSFQLLHTLSVLENVELPLLLAGEFDTHDRAQQQLDLVELGDLGDRMPHQLSGGQMQRVAIARAMVHAPKLLLADEPTGNLDTENSTAVLAILRDLNHRLGQTILMITHNPEAAGYGHRIVHMRDGHIE